MKILVFGAGANGKACQAYIEKFTQDELIGFLDNDPHKTSGKRYGGGGIRLPPGRSGAFALRSDFDQQWQARADCGDKEAVG